MKTSADLAREALAVLDRDGWGRNTLTDRKTGAHCIFRAVNIAATNEDSSCWLDDDRFYHLIGATIREQYPEFHWKIDRWVGTNLAEWNDRFATEADVRAVLEKISAG